MSRSYETVIGLEVHAQLLTKSKIFCGCPTAFGAAPNTQTCPVCLGLPGVLPVLNKAAVELALKAGLAMHGQPLPSSRFARKNYFYPDLPKGYQISQYELPLIEGGHVEVPSVGATRRVGLHRIHLEEDAGKNLHEGIADASHLDFNRCGVPLIEIVSQPDLRQPADAAAYLKRVREILVYLEICDGNMEEGSLRCDANLSLRPPGETEMGVKVEVKNLNSFRFVQKALEYEIQRQTEVLGRGGRVIQETRLFDPEQGRTVSMRSKEEAHDYRYFPEPDLVPLAVDQGWLETLRKTLPELPDEKRARFVRDYGLPEYDAEVLASSRALADYFEAVARRATSPKLPKTASNWVMGEILRLLNADGRPIEECPIRPEALADLLEAVEQGVVSGTQAKAVCEEMYRTGQPADAIIEAKGWHQVSDDASLDRWIEEALRQHPKEVEAYRQGKTKLFGFLVGQVMKASGGRANPARLNELLKRRLTGPDG